jgi:acetyl-CoA carboxylase carboxyl transferase subunit alpha
MTETFERSDPDLDRQLQDIDRETERLRRLSQDPSLNLADQIALLEARAEELRTQIYANPSPWHVVQLARHLQRPRLVDYVSALFTDVTELHGDRTYRDDPAMFAALARFEDAPLVVVGHYKGRDTKENIARNFGMPYPEGYRKALRVMRLAEKFHYPIVTFIDTPGAFPGDEAEARGQAEAIARNIAEMSGLMTPIVVLITGEGGSGGALAIAVGDVLLMLQYAIYTVISPEGCAAILWRDASRAREAAEALKLTATDLQGLGIVDEIIPEPLGGGHRDPDTVISSVRDVLRRHLAALRAVPVDALLERRYEKYRLIGQDLAMSQRQTGG